MSKYFTLLNINKKWLNSNRIGIFYLLYTIYKKSPSKYFTLSLFDGEIGIFWGYIVM